MVKRIAGRTKFDIWADNISRMKYFQYRILASHMFKWVNLPPGLDSEKMELMLIDRGAVAYFNTTTGHYVLPFSSDGQIDVYGNLVSVRAVPYNGLQLEQLDYVPRILLSKIYEHPHLVHKRIQKLKQYYPMLHCQ